MSTRRDKEAEELLNRLNRGEKPPPIASRVGKFIFFPRGPISRVVGTLLFRIIAGTTVGSAALFVISIGALVAGISLGPSDSELKLAGIGGIALALFWTFASFRRWATQEREVRHIENLADEYMKGGEQYVSGMHIIELTERLRQRRLTPDQFERLAIVWKGMQDVAGRQPECLNEAPARGKATATSGEPRPADRRAGRWLPFDDAAKTEFVNLIVSMLELQKSMAGDAHGSIEDENGHLKRKAVGYVYGYVDAALRSIGQDMADMSVGVPVTFQVIRKLWPNRAMECMDFLAKNLRSDALVATGITHGGQQYIDYSKPDAAGAPMGLGRFLIEDDEKRESPRT